MATSAGIFYTLQWAGRCASLIHMAVEHGDPHLKDIPTTKANHQPIPILPLAGVSAIVHAATLRSAFRCGRLSAGDMRFELDAE